jgi:hypothetical protein
MRSYPTFEPRRFRRQPGAASRAKAIGAPQPRWWWRVDEDDLTIAVAAVASAVAISLALM